MSEHVWIVGVSGATRFYAALAALFPPTSQRITWRSDSSAPCRASSHEHCQDFCRVPLALATLSKISHILAALSKKIPASKLLPEPLLLEVIQPSQQTVSRTSQPLHCFFMLFHSCPSISHHPITPPNTSQTWFSDATVQISPMFQHKIYHLGFHVWRDLNHLLTKSRCSNVCGLLDKAPTSKGLLLKWRLINVN